MEGGLLHYPVWLWRPSPTPYNVACTAGAFALEAAMEQDEAQVRQRVEHTAFVFEDEFTY